MVLPVTHERSHAPLHRLERQRVRRGTIPELRRAETLREPCEPPPLFARPAEEELSASCGHQVRMLMSPRTWDAVIMSVREECA